MGSLFRKRKALMADVKKKLEAQRSETERLLIETAGSAVDFWMKPTLRRLYM